MYPQMMDLHNFALSIARPIVNRGFQELNVSCGAGILPASGQDVRATSN